MKIYINYDYEDHNRIRAIQTLSHYLEIGKTEEEVDKAVANRNSEVGWEKFKIMEVSDEVEHVIRFILGEKEYKAYDDITSVYNVLHDIKSDIDSMYDDCYHMREYIESTLDRVKKLVPEEDR